MKNEIFESCTYKKKGMFNQMNFSWHNWIVIFIVGQRLIPYIWDTEFYDTGMKKVLIK